MNHEHFMRMAMGEARLAMGNTHPNPAVGCVIVHENKIVARGHTAPYGDAHAEVNALRTFQNSGISPNRETTLYVTLEPCSTQGNTPPCTDTILQSKIPRVVIGANDPNPAHNGRGLNLLDKAGLELVSGVLAEECEDLNLIFNHWIQHQTPFIAAKIATTLDGRIATRGGFSKWITGPESRANVMEWRRYFPAIAVGAGTVLADNPSLTARFEADAPWCPWRLVFDRNLISFKDDLPELYTDDYADRTIVITSPAKRETIQKWADQIPIKYWILHESNHDSGMKDFVEKCKEASFYGVYVEGGSQLLSSFLRNKQLHYLFSYRAPKLLADGAAIPPFLGQEPETMNDAIGLKAVRHQFFGPDQLMRGFIHYPEK